MGNVTGYDKLAQFMENEQYAIFRQFKLSANRDLLYLQAELVHLEDEFSKISSKDKDSKGDEGLYACNWRLLSSAQDRQCDAQQWKKALEIRAKLREYCTQVLDLTEIPC